MEMIFDLRTLRCTDLSRHLLLPMLLVLHHIQYNKRSKGGLPFWILSIVICLRKPRVLQDHIPLGPKKHLLFGRDKEWHSIYGYHIPCLIRNYLNENK